MNLIIDIGNTFTKLALIKGNEMVKQDRIATIDFDEDYLEKFSSHDTIKRAILSSVIEHPLSIGQFIRKKCTLIEFGSSSNQLNLPLKNLYKTPTTLGNDRLAAAIGANHLFRDQNVLVIDAGTCIKYDFVNDKNEYLGGAISPGLEMRFKALNTFTGKLPLLNIPKTLEIPLTGDNTMDSITSGVMNGAIAEVKEIVNQYRQKHEKVQVVLAGGDVNFFENQLKNSIFADPYLVLKGLNVILNYNA